MKEVLLRCYPETPPKKIHVIPWGIWPATINELPLPRNVGEGWGEGSPVLLTLSRISPEKGQDRLLKALALWEARTDYPPQGLTLFICGEAAYMKGRQFLKQLHSLAARLKKTRVIFPGYVSGAQKQDFFEQADLYVFPSRHESYGITLLEALQAGLPVVACANHGTREIVQPSFGRLVEGRSEEAMIEGLRHALADLWIRRKEWPAMKAAAQAFAARHSFANSASRLATLLQA